MQCNTRISSGYRFCALQRVFDHAIPIRVKADKVQYCEAGRLCSSTQHGGSYHTDWGSHRQHAALDAEPIMLLLQLVSSIATLHIPAHPCCHDHQSIFVTASWQLQSDSSIALLFSHYHFKSATFQPVAAVSLYPTAPAHAVLHAPTHVVWGGGCDAQVCHEPFL